MAIELTGTSRILIIPGYNYPGRKSYLKKAESIINFYTKGLNNDELSFFRSLVLPVNGRWPNVKTLKSKCVVALETIDEKMSLVVYYSKHKEIITKLLSEWNGLTTMAKPEFLRKMEGLQNPASITIRPMMEFGVQYLEFVALSRSQPNVNALSIIKATIQKMAEKRWKGIITPKVCLALLRGVKLGTIKKATRMKEIEL